ncbi:hypothetical protein [Fictibacillus nanhaiensis]|uniref:hypothetical protein n=1 Tax=Fictibacillus nanhaiensis TaxID=742169 RepID=UPI003C289FB4
MQTGQVPAQMNHGGHEMFDVHEMLSGIVGTLNLYTLCKGHVQNLSSKRCSIVTISTLQKKITRVNKLFRQEKIQQCVQSLTR